MALKELEPSTEPAVTALPKLTAPAPVTDKLPEPKLMEELAVNPCVPLASVRAVPRNGAASHDSNIAPHHYGAFCLSEPEAGSDATSQRTTAEDKGDHYVINGIKNWITNGNSASVYLVIAQTDRSKGSKGINAFIVEKNSPGVTVGAKENKLGIRGSDTHSISFQDVKVPKENRIGEDGFGFKFAMKTLAGGRIGIAAQALGIASGAYELALAYSKQRKAFGKEIMHHQAIQFKLADMATKIEAARLLCLKAAWEKDNGIDYTLSSSMAKVFASEAAMWTATEAVQVHGGYGFVKEYHVERLMRDAKITQIYEGTSEVQRIVISRSILK